MSTYYAKTKGTTVCDTDRSEVSSDNTNITGWKKADKFIYCVAIGQDGRDPAAGVFSLQWKGGSQADFIDLGSTGELKYTTDTVLNNGDPLISDNAKVAVSDMTWQNGEEIEDGVSASINLDSDYYSELQFGVDPAGTSYNTTYSFQLYNNTLGGVVLVETGSIVTVTTGSQIVNFFMTVDDEILIN